MSSHQSTSTPNAQPQTHVELRPMGQPLPFPAYLKETWRRREFAFELARSDMRTQNVNTVLGGLWHLLNPLLLAGVYFLIFGVLLSIDRGQDNYIAFLVIGVFTFHYTGKSIRSGSRSIASNVGLIRSVSFPRVLLPCSTVLGESLAMIPTVIAMLLIVIATGAIPTLWWLVIVPAILLQGIFTLGLTLALSRLTHHLPDVQQVIPYALRIWLYASGVFYAVERFVDHEIILSLFSLNPMYAYISIVRDGILQSTWDPLLWSTAGMWSTLLLIGGFLFFRRREHEYGND